MSILALIPARGGSKSIPRKNLIDLAGRPLIAWTIDAALSANSCSRAIVSTDDVEIANTAKALGAEVPFARPKELAGDRSTAQDVVRHALRELERHDKWSPELVVYLQPTSPFRTVEHIESAIKQFEAQKPDVLVSIREVPHAFSPESILVDDGREIRRFCPQGKEELRRQDKVVYWARNGPAILIATAAYLKDEGALYRGSVIGYRMSALDSLDIDSPEDLVIAQAVAQYRRG